jgi:fibronectin-binding autotransporter adhesin
MKGAWQSVRWFLLVACAGGVLAADNTWISTFNADLINPLQWFSSRVSTDAAEASVAVELPRGTAPGAEISMGGLINGLLFARPAGRWVLDSRAADSRTSLGRRIVEYEQINPISSGDHFITYNAPASFTSISTVTQSVATDGSASPASPSAVTATGTWTSNASGNWGDQGNWQGLVVADGAGNAANFDTLNITTNVTVTLDTSRTIGDLFIGDTDGTHSYTIAAGAGNSLTFNSGSDVTSVLRQTSTSAGDTISAPVVLANSLDVFNDAATNVLTISGNISTSAPNSAFTLLTFRSGNVNVTGNINNGTDDLFVSVSGGTVVFSGTNTYAGQTSVEAFDPNTATLLVNGNNAGATGTVFVSGDGSVLGGTGTIGGNVLMFGESTITGATTGTVGTLTMTQDLIMATGEGAGGIYLANLLGSTSDLLAITGNLTLGLGSGLDIQGTADGFTTYTLATFADRNSTEFEFVSGVPGGYNLVYHDSDIQLVPIPEPATWIGGALLLATLGFTQRRRLARFAFR